MLNLARQEAGTDQIHKGTSLPQAYTGEGVVVGVVDAGFDYMHAAFRRPDDGQLRIKRVWEQGTQTLDGATAPTKYGYGIELNTPELIEKAQGDSDTNSHGTHVAAIAAGSDAYKEGTYVGNAPDADIVLVALDLNESTNADISNAVQYIFDYADEVGKPCVVNLSLGNQDGPHDGTSTFDTMTEMLAMQKEEANIGFAKFIARNYLEWIDLMRNGNASSSDDRPMMSPDVFRNRIFPILDKGEKVFLIVIDNFRYDQWKMLAADIGELFDIDEDMYMSILPTATQYARNAIFSGLMPNRIAEMFPELWVDEDEEEGKNLNEEPLIQTMLDRYRKRYSFSYHKVNDSQGADRFMEHYNECREKDLNVLVINFIDMLSHARTESKMVRELANTESAYRSITQSWLRHSVLSELFRRLSQDDCKVVITTDHGSIRASKPIKIIGDRNTNTNLRYKLGKNLACNANEVFTIRDPKRAQLPAPNLSTSYVFAYGDAFFAYPNNYNYYVSYYKDTFQHGGISMEEMLIPLITLTPRKR
jgi:hypothetical protein